MSETWVEPQPRAVVIRQVVKSLTGRGYKFVNKTGPFVTAPKFSWPANPVFNLWRGLVYPGAVVTVVIEPSGPWTRLRLSTRLVCETGQHPPPGHPQDVNFETFVLDQTQSDALWAISGPLQRLKVRVFAESCAALNEGDQKIDVCRRMAEARPREADALRQYVLALARFYRARKAWQPLRDLIALEGERDSTYSMVGAAMLEANGFEDARKLYERATVLWPMDPRMAYYLGRAHLGLHALQQARDAFETATRLDSAFADAHTYAAVAGAQLGLMDDARRHCSAATHLIEAAITNRADDIDTWLGLSYCASLFARHTEAVSYFARAHLISYSRARATPELLDLIISSHDLVGDQPPAPLPH